MKKVVLGLALLAAAVAAILYLGGMMIDPAIAIGTDRHLAAPAGSLWRYLDNVDGLGRWWASPRLAVKKEAGPDRGVGLVVLFEADGAAVERWTVRALDPPRQITYDVEFIGGFNVERTLTLAPDGNRTQVRWRENGTLESPLMRWRKVLSTPDSVVANFDRALAALEQVASSSVAR